ncbi:MAG: hypothetical protein ACRDEA_13655, partial [Microcystaceae cyanobacterium]
AFLHCKVQNIWLGFMNQAKQATFELLAQKAHENPDFRRVYCQWNNFRKKSVFGMGLMNWHLLNSTNEI